MIIWTDHGIVDTKTGFEYRYRHVVDRYEVIQENLCKCKRVLYTVDSEAAAERHLTVLYDELQGEDRIIELRRP